jgi:hypothetical protein
VPPDDPKALAETLRQVVEGEVDLDALGTAASATAAKTLDIHAVGRAYDEVFAQVAGLAGPGDPSAPSGTGATRAGVAEAQVMGSDAPAGDVTGTEVTGR